MYDVGTQLVSLRRDKFLALVRKHRPWLTPKETAAYLGLAVRTLESWRASGKGPSFRKNAHARLIPYHIDAVDEFLNTQRSSARQTASVK